MFESRLLNSRLCKGCNAPLNSLRGSGKPYIAHVKIVFMLFSLSQELVNRLKNFLPFILKKLLVQTLVMPHFDYCDSLFTDLSVNLAQRLQCVYGISVTFTDLTMLHRPWKNYHGFY